MSRKNKRFSIIQKDLNTCIVCDRFGTEKHHVVFGNNRKLSDKYGLLVGLCYEHHQGTYGVHGREGNKINRILKEMAQEAFERQVGTREDFMEIFGRSFL